MLSIYSLKPEFQNLLRPFSNWLASYGVTANEVTVTAMLFSFIAGVIIYYHPMGWALCLVPFVLFMRMMLNAIDGMLAREHGMKTSLGAILNELGDVLSDTFLYIPFAFIPNISASLIVLIVILAIISEMMGVAAIQIGASRRYDGPMGKSDRAFIFGLLGLVLGCGFKFNTVCLNFVLVSMVILLVVTILNRIQHALQETVHAR